MKIQCISRFQAGCDYYRIVLPFIYLQKDPEWNKNNSVEMLWISQDEPWIECDILIYNKLINTSINDLREMQSKGMKIVVDMDDYWVLPPSHANAEWNRSGNDKLTVEHMKIADLVICSSLRLQEQVREFNKNTVVIPNALPFGEGVYQPGPKQERDKMHFLYAGGYSHLPDVKLLEGKFRKINSEPFIKDRARFILVGYDKAKQHQKVYANKKDYDEKNDKFTIEVKEIKGPYDDMLNIFKHTCSYEVYPTLPIPEYMNYYDMVDVGLVPLADTSWNSMKSELKLLELATRDIMGIVSSVSPYSDLRPCEGICFVEKPDDWLSYIRKSVKEPLWVKEQGLKMSEWVKENYELRKWNLTRAEVLNSLLC